MKLLLPLILVACGAAQRPPESQSLSVPPGWRSETIPFPLQFAPSIALRGVEELRFAPGFFDPAAPGYWSYAFVWRSEGRAELDAGSLGRDLTTYFRGLIDAVDEQKRITARDEIIASAEPDGDRRFRLRAHVFDAFKTAAPLDLTGFAERRVCDSGDLWIFVLASETSPLRAELDALADTARCGQKPLP
jgi:hypothetical protein